MQCLQMQTQFHTQAFQLLDITRATNDLLAASKLRRGILHLFVKHTSASLIIQENADPDVLRDLSRFMTNLVPESDSYFHSAEGPDDMPAHIRSVLTQTQLSVPFDQGQLCLGTWQAIYLWEHRSKSHDRTIVFSFQGD